MSIFYSVRYFVHRTKSVFLHLEMRSGNFFFTTSSTNDSDTRVYEKGKQKTFSEKWTRLICTIWVPVKCEMKRETKYTETERNEMKRNEIYQNETKRNEAKWNVTIFTETKRNGTKQNEMYTKTGRECNLAKRIYRNGTKQNMSKHTCLFQARSGWPLVIYMVVLVGGVVGGSFCRCSYDFCLFNFNTKRRE
jgi:hypothetical protein